MPGFDPGLLRRALTNHTRRDGYWLALIHGRGNRRYDLDGQPRTEVPAVLARRPLSPPPQPATGPPVRMPEWAERPARMPDRADPAPDRPMPPVAFKKKRRVVPPPNVENDD